MHTVRLEEAHTSYYWKCPICRRNNHTLIEETGTVICEYCGEGCEVEDE